jgi:hypothetical protein
MVANPAGSGYNAGISQRFPRMVKEGDYLAVFNSIHRVMKAEQYLKERRLPILLIPAPRAVSADCGLAIRYAGADRETVENALAAAGLLPETVFVKQGEFYILCRKEEADPENC